MMCKFHESTCNGFGDIWWTDNPIYFSSIDIMAEILKHGFTFWMMPFDPIFN